MESDEQVWQPCHWEAICESSYKGDEREKVATRFLLLRAVLLGCKSSKAFYPNSQISLTLWICLLIVLPCVSTHALTEIEVSCIHTQDLGVKRSAHRNQRTRPNRRWLLVDGSPRGLSALTALSSRSTSPARVEYPLTYILSNGHT